jgi:23S rRNA (cytidine1920-2'-O)/16S rRNA (cytidine1409-2'-O)-methyltransferase
LQVVEVAQYVGRGAYKLAAALDSFAIDPAGLRCLDVGASTGGFTDVLLQRGAAEVVALDVGFGQLHERIRADPRVTVLERTNMRHTGPGDLGPTFRLVVADVSFISLRVLLRSLIEQLAGNGDLVVLIKPQFEVGHREASRGRGVITDPQLWRQSIEGVVEAAVEQHLELRGMRVSPISGGDGNIEFLARFTRHGDGASAPALVDAVIEEATAVTAGHLR